MLIPDSVKVPEPTLTRLPAPLITPENVWSFVSPVVKVIPFASETLPAPDKDWIVSVVSTW